ncbi:MAG: metallophosphoesterase [Planctomycetales bacterium]|nr:metallophosphoesterase [Planctomycetales bacterium]
MTQRTIRSALLLAWLVAGPLAVTLLGQGTETADQPFGPKFPKLDSQATGNWWEVKNPKLLVPRDQVLAFAVYTHDRGVLKLTAQLYPLKPDESREVRLQLQRDGQWQQVATEPVNELGWSAHFRLADWDNTQNVPYRLLHGDDQTGAKFEGLIRRDPIDKNEIVVGTLSCNSSRTPGPRPKMVENLKRQDPDLLFFAGDQSYHHTQHTFGWLEFGVQFRDVLKDRPTITIPDDHDVGQANIWGENGKVAATPAGPRGGFFYPPKYVNMVQRCQTWHLPDPYDATPIQQGITVYYTNLRVGGVDFAIVEDRKFKSGPEGKIPKMGPRPDHINDPNYDRKSVDLPGLKLLGDRQLKFLNEWGQNWTGAEMKCVLSQTAFCGAVHLHGTPENRLLADLDCNGWPQTGRNRALREIRRAWAPHLCGDQHLAVVVQHGIDSFRDGPFGFTSPAIVNTIYGRWWHPLDERPGPNPIPGSPLAWTGDFEDGLGNAITMHAYANPENRQDETKRADGYGIARFRKKEREITFECWHRFADVRDGDKAQFPGWPITIRQQDNDGRKVVGYLPELVFSNQKRPVGPPSQATLVRPGGPVVQIVEKATREIVYTVRPPSSRFRPPVYAPGAYDVRIGDDQPTRAVLQDLTPAPAEVKREIRIEG